MGIPLTPTRSATAAALLLVGPVFAISRPSLFLSRESPVAQAGSVYVDGGSKKVPVGSNATILAFVGHPMPPSQDAFTSLVWDGSKFRALAAVEPSSAAPASDGTTNSAARIAKINGKRFKVPPSSSGRLNTADV